MIQLRNKNIVRSQSSIHGPSHVIPEVEVESDGTRDCGDHVEKCYQLCNSQKSHRHTASLSKAAVFLNNAAVTLLQMRQFKEACVIMQHANSVWRNGAMGSPWVSSDRIAVNASHTQEVNEKMNEARKYLSIAAASKSESNEGLAARAFLIEKLSTDLEYLTNGNNSLQEQLIKCSFGTNKELINTCFKNCLFHPIIVTSKDKDLFLEESDIAYYTSILLHNLAISFLALSQSHPRGGYHKKAMKILALCYAAICKIKTFLPSEDSHFVDDSDNDNMVSYCEGELLHTLCILRTKLLIVQTLGLSWIMALKQTAQTPAQVGLLPLLQNVGSIWNRLHAVNASLKKVRSARHLPESHKII